MASQVRLDMLKKIQTEKGFIAALDQSGGSTPEALRRYGIPENRYSGDEEMFTKVHKMRTRIMTSEAFSGDRILAAILFENTLDREIEGLASADYLWQKKHIVPFLKVDIGLEEQHNGVQLMKPIRGLNDLLDKAVDKKVFGTKMRSVIKLANNSGIHIIVAQQFAVAAQILAKGLVPIIEAEIDIYSPEKGAAELLLRGELLKQLDAVPVDQQVMLKLSLPKIAGFYDKIIAHPRVLKVVALSGGYSREKANRLLSENKGMIASFSRALSEELFELMSDDEFESTINESIDSIYQASNA
ncbi:fructose bisphosphate aldolase [Paraglaciecola arctica]|uniref:fructose-bisphosphate aldolase n=1 Tax=Paraglaciecola arctica BSs20135 TaxID=493475 RepID=K6ZFJ4_9ALTE|nr:fructose bisphosphate aldolase [Paraglaciecola arctica]GAC22185.1 fructose-bisphosphate aldolase class 1 [Paraglaciecola arctica BSs20135]